MFRYLTVIITLFLKSVTRPPSSEEAKNAEFHGLRLSTAKITAERESVVVAETKVYAF